MKILQYVLLASALSACQSEDLSALDKSPAPVSLGLQSSALTETITGATGPTGPMGSSGAVGATGAAYKITQSIRCQKHIETGACGGVSFRYSVNILDSGDKFVSCFVLTDKFGWQLNVNYKSGEPGHSTAQCVFPTDHNIPCGATGVGNYTFTYISGVAKTVFTNTPVHVDGAAYPQGYLHNAETIFTSGDCAIY